MQGIRTWLVQFHRQRRQSRELPHQNVSWELKLVLALHWLSSTYCIAVAAVYMAKYSMESGTDHCN